MSRRISAQAFVLMLVMTMGASVANDPSGPAVVVASCAGGPVSVSAASITTRAPGVVVPVTVTVFPSMVLPPAGAVCVVYFANDGFSAPGVPAADTGAALVGPVGGCTLASCIAP